MAEPLVLGWDIGGAHAKAALLRGGRVLDVAQWPCPLWQGLEALQHAVAQAGERWPALRDAHHAVTMSGEMVDLFAHREDGVQRIVALLAGLLPAGRLHVWAGDAGWLAPEQAPSRWAQIASANWLALARHVALARRGEEAVLVDIGSTTTDLIPLRAGQVASASRSDAERLASGELVYSGVVRTPLCALAAKIAWRGRPVNVMREFFATTADVYRLTGELDPRHDQHPAADNGAKDAAATCQRLARMIGHDARDGSAEDWLDFARAWRSLQVEELRHELKRVATAQSIGRHALLIAAGCGAFLVDELRPGPQARLLRYAGGVAAIDAGAPAGTAGWVDVAAPACAVAALRTQELG